MAFQRYPLVMNHPHYRPAVNSGYQRHSDGSATNDPPGAPAKFPPVTVNNLDQEQDYAGRGYLPAGVSDPEAYLRATIGADIPGTYKFQEYPKWLYRVQAGDKGPDVTSQMVQSEPEERRLGRGWGATPDAAWELYEQSAVETASRAATNDDAPAPRAPAKKAAKKAAKTIEQLATEKPRRKYTRRPKKKASAPAATSPSAAGADAAQE